MARRPELVVDGQTNADAAYMNTILDALGDLLLLKKELGDGSAESVIDILNKFPGSSSLNLLLNPHFDVYDSNGNLQYWTAFASSVSQVSTSTDNSLGHDFVKITTDGSGNNAGIKQTTAESSILLKWLNIVKAQQLYLSFKVKVRSSVPVSVAINDTVVNSAGNGTWEEIIVKRKFTGTETDISAQIYLPGTTNTAATDIEVGEATLVVGSTISNIINQGIKSGLDADTVDGYDIATTPTADSIPVSDANGSLKDWITDDEILTKIKNVDGSGSGLDTDLVRGLPADFTSSLAGSGYQKLPSGLIVQWGNVTYSGVTFPIAFPTAVLGVYASPGVVSNVDHPNTAEIRIAYVTLTGFTVNAYRDGTGDVTAQGVNWLAIGY